MSASPPADVVIDLPGRGSRPPAAQWAVGALAGALGVAGCVVGSSALGAGRPRPDLEAGAVVLLALAAGLGGLVGGHLVAARRGRLRVAAGEHALLLRGSRAPVVAYWPFVGVALLAVPVLVHAQAAGAARVSLLQQVLLAGLAMCGAGLAVQLLRTRPAELVLRRDSIEVRPAFRPGRVLGWGDVAPVAAGPRPLEAMLANGSTGLGERTLASDPALVAAVLEHYRATPGDRAELASGRAVDRLRNGRF